MKAIRERITDFLLDLQATGYNIRWVQGLFRVEDGKEYIKFYDTQTMKDLGRVETTLETLHLDDPGDIIREMKYPLLDEETRRKHIEGMVKVDPSYAKYLEPEPEEEEPESYEEQAERIAKELGVRIETEYRGWDYHFYGDTQKRAIFAVKIIREETEEREERAYSLRFGQSIAAGQQPPTIYDILACVQKYCPGEDLQEFCDNFGYDIEDEATEGIYELVQQEYEGMCYLFSEEELEKLSEIA